MITLNHSTFIKHGSIRILEHLRFYRALSKGLLWTTTDYRYESSTDPLSYDASTNLIRDFQLSKSIICTSGYFKYSIYI
jgi:hypothetical protein